MTKKVRDNTWFELNQCSYIDQLQQIPSNADFTIYRSARAKVSWICHTRPDICCAVNRACQVSELKFQKRHIRSLNKLIRRIKNSKSMVLKYHKLDINSLHIRVYSDASFASNEDNSSQLGYIIMLADRNDNVHVLSYCSKKSKRIVRSIMAGEVFAFSAAFDQAYVIRHDIQRILGIEIGITMYTDSKQLFDVITRAAHTTEKRLMVEIMAAREAYNRYEISNVGLVPGDSNPADRLTKPKIFVQLNELLHQGVDSTKVSQWIYRMEQD